MAFVKIKGFKGMMYIPEESESPKKHPCADCFSCNFCSDERCDLCLKGKTDYNSRECKCKKNPDD